MEFDNYKNQHIVGCLETLFKKYWNDDYLNQLAIVDHCREVVQLWDKNKQTKSDMDRFSNEATDLLILLSFQHMVLYNKDVDIDYDLILSRLEKFQRKLEQKSLQEGVVL